MVGDPGRDVTVGVVLCPTCKSTRWPGESCTFCLNQSLQALKDGGTRTTFRTGSQRDTQDGKPRPDLIPVRAQLRKAVIHMLGSIKYDERNWEKGQPQSQFLASLMRHLYYWMMGDTSEDHLAQAGWNLDCLLDQEERCHENKLPLDLLNLPHYNGGAQSIINLPTRVFLGKDTKAAAKAAQDFRASVEAARAKAKE